MKTENEEDEGVEKVGTKGEEEEVKRKKVVKTRKTNRD